MPFMKSLPPDASQLHLFRRFPEIAKPLMEFTEVVLRGPSTLSVEEREIIGAYTSGLNACTYCYGTHKAAAEALGVDEGLLDRLLEDFETAGVDEKLKPILRYVRKLTKTPTQMTQADADAIFDAGWDDNAFHYAVTICAMFNYYNRILEGHGIHGDHAYHLEAGQRLANLGYEKLLALL